MLGIRRSPRTESVPSWNDWTGGNTAIALAAMTVSSALRLAQPLPRRQAARERSHRRGDNLLRSRSKQQRLDEILTVARTARSGLSQGRLTGCDAHIPARDHSRGTVSCLRVLGKLTSSACCRTRPSAPARVGDGLLLQSAAVETGRMGLSNCSLLLSFVGGLPSDRSAPCRTICPA